jgi:hypothetical protein
VDPKEVAKAISLDLWVCHHFRVLPTEERYKRLTDNQKNLLFLGWLELPTSEQIKEWYTKKIGEPVVTEQDAKDFVKLGYSKSQIKRIREQLENAGYHQQD